MPKMKTHSGAKKRLRLTGKGRVRRAKAGKQHLMRGKGRTRLRKLQKRSLVDKTNEPAMKRLLACGG